MQITVDLITTRKEIYKALEESLDNQSIIGIASKDFGSGMFLTTVKEIINDREDVIIVLNSYDTTGYFVEKNKVPLGRITGVIPFKAVFTNPFLRDLTEKEDTAREGNERSQDYIF